MYIPTEGDGVTTKTIEILFPKTLDEIKHFNAKYFKYKALLDATQRVLHKDLKWKLECFTQEEVLKNDKLKKKLVQDCRARRRCQIPRWMDTTLLNGILCSILNIINYYLHIFIHICISAEPDTFGDKLRERDTSNKRQIKKTHELEQKDEEEADDELQQNDDGGNLSKIPPNLRNDVMEISEDDDADPNKHNKNIKNEMIKNKNGIFVSFYFKHDISYFWFVALIYTETKAKRARLNEAGDAEDKIYPPPLETDIGIIDMSKLSGVERC